MLNANRVRALLAHVLQNIYGLSVSIQPQMQVTAGGPTSGSGVANRCLRGDLLPFLHPRAAQMGVLSHPSLTVYLPVVDYHIVPGDLIAPSGEHRTAFRGVLRGSAGGPEICPIVQLAVSKDGMHAPAIVGRNVR